MGMNTPRMLLFFALLTGATSASAQLLGASDLQRLKPGTWISVMTPERHICQFVSASGSKFVCRAKPENPVVNLTGPIVAKSPALETYDLINVSVSLAPYDWSRGIDFLSAVEGGGGLDSKHQASSFAGVKLGLSYASLDLQYDRVEGHSGFSTEGSAVIPLYRVPRFRWDRNTRFLRFYAEPGVGYRAGDGPFGGYSSAKVMAVLLTDTWSEKWVAPYVEFQRRFPFESPLQGDNRIAFGIMHMDCGGCLKP